MIIAYVGLGSNVGKPKDQIMRALAECEQLPHTQLIQASSLYQTKPWGMTEQDDFINAVVQLNTKLSAFDLLAQMLAIERNHMRVRNQKNGPRTLDCDLLLYGDEVIHTASLIVPHPYMTQRNFVLIPLYEIAPDLRLQGKPIASYIQHPDDTVIKIR